MLAHISNRGRILAASFALFCFGLLLSAYTARNQNVARVGYVLVSELVAPLQRLSRGTHDLVWNTWHSYIALIDVHQDNQLLRERLAVLQDHNLSLIEYKEENSRLRNLLALSQDSTIEGVAVRVIGQPPSSWTQSVTVDKGSHDGIDRGFAAVVGRRVVGQVVRVGRISSQVLLITDHASGVDVTIQSSRARGTLEGSGRGKTRLRFVSLEEQVKVGERVITSGFDGVFPRGLLVGVVRSVDSLDDALFHRIDVEPAIDFSKLEELFIVMDRRRDEK